mmetsp:Transcript_8200/g.27551  ORF Transcript_8200/g.27551 Transcript_8200/m.27551 type:complete len:590 (+) Transcript_8200:528-2297(+)
MTRIATGVFQRRNWMPFSRISFLRQCPSIKRSSTNRISFSLPRLVVKCEDIIHLTNIFPQGESEIKFPAFMYLIYEVLCEMPGSSISGKFRGISFKPAKATPGSAAVGENSEFWKELNSAFSVLEADFVRFDQDRNGFVDYTEITNAIPPTRPGYDRLDTLSRLQHAFHQVDLNQDQTLDFYEFCYLCFMMTQNGSYLDLVHQTEGAAKVKKAFINIHTCYRSFDADHNNRLTYDELEMFCNSQFGIVPPNLQSLFGEIAQKSASAGGQVALDLVRFMKLLYVLVCPTAQFAPTRYSPGKRTVNQQVISILKPPKSDRPPRFKVVVPSKFVKEKLLGQGGQGTVYKGKYEGFSVAAKTMLGNPDAHLLADTLREVDFFLKLDHPNCHFLLGAKTTLENGGIMLLTEICESGSLFDCYSTKRLRFDRCTAWRISKECALGFKVIHDMGFMHRDIKSLNVFMTKDMVAKVADFGMCTNNPTATDPMGTPQWMAPEVISNMLGIRCPYNKSCDIYSYGILVWETFVAMIPYASTGLNQSQIAMQVYRSNIRPPMISSLPASIKSLIAECWDKNPHHRPNFDTVCLLFQFEFP